MTTSTHEISRCLTRLALAYPTAPMTEMQVKATVTRYGEDLARFEPEAVRIGCDDAARACKRFPTLAELLPFVQRAAEDAKQRREHVKTITHDAGAVCRNEAICLLADYDTVMRRTLEADSIEYANLLAECARWWELRRPPGGLPELDKQRQRGRVGREIETFAAQRLALPQRLPEEAAAE
jgi:hypothetical protein